MPTFTAIALDKLLEPRSQNPAPRRPPVPIKAERSAEKPVSKKSIPPPRTPNISPTLYATPETTPLPDSPASFLPPSPYIVNHKRRGPCLLKSSLVQNGTSTSEVQDGTGSTQQENGTGVTQPIRSDDEQKLDLVSGNEAEVVLNGIQDLKSHAEQNEGDWHQRERETVIVGFYQRNLQKSILNDKLAGAQDFLKPGTVVLERDTDEFFDPQESLSTASITDVDDSFGPGQCNPGASMSEYHDAFQEASGDASKQSLRLNIEEELHEIRLSLLTEIERRKQAQEALENLQTKWQMLSHHLSRVDLKLPCPPTITTEIEGNLQSNVDPVEELCRQVIVSRFVADAVGRACSRAQVEMEFEPKIKAKNFEIARLLDRLHFYEAANTEMCHRNQEAVELARQHRNRLKRRQKWFWSSIGVLVTAGVAAIAWSYMPVSRPSAAEGAGTNTNSSESI